MKKERFIERLNLHLDGELSPTDSEDLFRAIRRNEEYHRIYVQYCQIYNACSELGGRFVEERPSSPLKQKVYAFGGMAAAIALLALAAQNLAPVIGIDGGSASTSGVELAVAEPQSTNEAPAEPLVVLDVNNLKGRPLTVNDVQFASFDVDAAFDDATREAVYYDAKPAVAFASFKVKQPTGSIQQASWQKPFLLEKPVPASTFEHEALSAQDSATNAFNQEQVAASSDAQSSDGQIRFDLRRSSTFSATGIDSQVSAATSAAKPVER